ncbi:MAG: ATP-binding protein [Bdellovibrionota bacterium]|nr:MAG: response regulator [Pseudomonadota bacterium]
MIDLFKIQIRDENDIVNCRQRVRQIAGYLGLDNLQQTQVSTAASEAARNAVRHGGGGTVRLRLENRSPYCLEVELMDQGPGIPDLNQALLSTTGLGLKAYYRLMDSCTIESTEKGTTVKLRKFLPVAKAFESRELAQILQNLIKFPPADPSAEIKLQNRELIVALEELRKQQELSFQYQLRLEDLNKELADTNRGVIALNSELEDQAKRVVEAGEVKSRFLSHVTHEFRTPVNSLLSMSRILLSEGDNLRPEQSVQLKFIRQAAEGLSEMVNDLLDTVKMQARKISVVNSNLNLTEIFDALKALFRPLLPADRNIELIFEDCSHVPHFISDETKISQILRNFISNALKFTEEGSVVVRADLIDHDEIEICVIDTGIGIADKEQPHVFEEFYQVLGHHQRRAKGTGLGLSLAQKLAQLLGGKISLKSAPGVGSTFTLRLPYQAVKGMKKFSSTKKILVIDDDEASYFNLRDLLQARNCELAFARNGADGLKLVAAFAPDIIILDVRMPVMDGFEVLEHLKASSSMKNIPVLLNSSMNLTFDDFAPNGPRPDGILSKDALSRGDELQMIFDILSRGEEA